jgi:CheY-like chemotaxis protein
MPCYGRVVSCTEQASKNELKLSSISEASSTSVKITTNVVTNNNYTKRSTNSRSSNSNHSNQTQTKANTFLNSSFEKKRQSNYNTKKKKITIRRNSNSSLSLNSLVAKDTPSNRLVIDSKPDEFVDNNSNFILGNDSNGFFDGENEDDDHYDDNDNNISKDKFRFASKNETSRYVNNNNNNHLNNLSSSVVFNESNNTNINNNSSSNNININNNSSSSNINSGNCLLHALQNADQEKKPLSFYLSKDYLLDIPFKLKNNKVNPGVEDTAMNNNDSNNNNNNNNGNNADNNSLNHDEKILNAIEDAQNENAIQKNATSIENVAKDSSCSVDVVQNNNLLHLNNTVDSHALKTSENYNFNNNTSAENVTIKYYKVLLVDDAVISRKMVERSISAMCRNCHHANNGTEAIKKTLESIEKNDPYDVIIMDYYMPGMNGPEAIKIIREQGFKNLIIGVTGSISIEDNENLMESGANFILLKPFKLKDFRKILDRS